jgi:capsular polysaccharide biosynthesis protein/Mrp family chromosome partitioning ATPase
MEDRHDLASALITVRRRAWIVLASVVVAMGAAYGVTQLLVPRYESTATLFVGPSATTSDASVDVQYASLAQALVTSYARLAETRAVVDAAAGRLNLSRGEVAGHFETGVEEGVQVLTITARAQSGPRAASIANALAGALTDSVTRLSGPNGRHIGVQQVDRAVASASPASPMLSLNLLFGAVAGLLIGLALATGLERLDQRIRTAAEAEEALGLPVVGVVPRFGRKVKGLDALARHADPKLAEPFRNIAAALANSADRRRHRTLLLTSVSPGDGKTTVAAHLALALADHQRSTALIEADLRKPTFGKQFPSESLLPHLKVLAADKAENDPMAALQGTAFQQVLADAQRSCDLVLLDAPPALSTSDVSILAEYTDAVVLVVRAEETRADDCRELIVALKRLGTDVAGIVLTHARHSRRSGYYGSGRPAIVASDGELKAVGSPLAG